MKQNIENTELNTSNHCKTNEINKYTPKTIWSSIYAKADNDRFRQSHIHFASTTSGNRLSQGRYGQGFGEALPVKIVTYWYNWSNSMPIGKACIPSFWAIGIRKPKMHLANRNTCLDAKPNTSKINNLIYEETGKNMHNSKNDSLHLLNSKKWFKPEDSKDNKPKHSKLFTFFYQTIILVFFLVATLACNNDIDDQSEFDEHTNLDLIALPTSYEDNGLQNQSQSSGEMGSFKIHIQWPDQKQDTRAIPTQVNKIFISLVMRNQHSVFRSLEITRDAEDSFSQEIQLVKGEYECYALAYGNKQFDVDANQDIYALLGYGYLETGEYFTIEQGSIVEASLTIKPYTEFIKSVAYAVDKEFTTPGDFSNWQAGDAIYVRLQLDTKMKPFFIKKSSSYITDPDELYQIAPYYISTIYMATDSNSPYYDRSSTGTYLPGISIRHDDGSWQKISETKDLTSLSSDSSGEFFEFAIENWSQADVLLSVDWGFFADSGHYFNPKDEIDGFYSGWNEVLYRFPLQLAGEFHFTIQ